MELRISHEDGCVFAVTEGQIDAAAREPFHESLHPLIAQRNTKVVLDLSRSKFITSEGIGQLVALVVHANTSGSRVVLAACSPFIATILETCKLNRFFEIAASVPDAVTLLADS